MRILQVCPFYAPHVGGVETHVEMVSEELARRGHEVTVLTSRHAPELPEVERTPRGVTVRRVRSRGTVFRTPLALGTGRALRDLLPRPEVVHMHYPPPVTSYLAARALKAGGPPVCLTYHCDLFMDAPFGVALTAAYERIFLPTTLDVARKIIVHSQSYARTSRALQGRDIAVIPSLVDTDRFQPRQDDPELRKRLGAEGKKVVLFVGRLVPHKGVEDLILALSELPQDALLVVAGDGPRREALEEMANSNQVGARVRFVGAVSDADLPRYHAVASVVVLPSQNRLEGFGLAIVEAMASGRPAIVADLPGVREVIQDGVDGLLVEPLLAEDLAKKCASLLSDPSRRATMGAKARESALSKYRAQVVVEQLERLYRSIST
ncbi:MAG: glycosyltransferase family 4 protein [Euryarchaeota archaeon]|nr:glycosyltransferase family 4 protein [Euryarchaeota archaeon]MDE1835893.1 glycosyltransferase family 4 protein [Euryarchaeota archaeon]MDE1880232.1 glycosyltransferase family 4 protein [Euryarchaeota archaeon]MDE2044429.1 glycosyltransferase family 4 protein [Thermoplasmata archaeon]